MTTTSRARVSASGPPIGAGLRAAVEAAVREHAIDRRVAIAALARQVVRRVSGTGTTRLPFPRDLSNLPGLDANAVRCAEPLVARHADAALDALERDGANFGAALSGLSPLEESKDHGIVYTPPLLAALMVRLAVGALDGRVPQRALDPSAGTGAFLVELRRAIPDAAIFGIERDVSAVHLARLRLLAEDLSDSRPFAPIASRVVCGDGLDVVARRDELFGEFDLVVANPPYVRQERLDAATKHALHETLGRLESGALSKRSDLFVYFFVRLRELLAPGGAAAIVTSNSWLHTAYGAGLRRFLLRELEIVTVLETNAERWFGDAHVHGLVVVLRRPRAAQRCTTPVNFLVRTNPLVGDARERFAPPAYRVRRTEREQLQRREEAGGPPWTLELRAPDVFLEILERAGDHLVSLGDVARVKFGGKTGANGFFYVSVVEAPRDAQGVWLVRPLGAPRESRPLRVPAAWLERALVSPRELSSHVIREEDVTLRVLRLPADRRAFRGTDVERHVREGEAAGISARPSLRGRDPWWILPPSPDVPLLHSLIVDERPGAFLVEGARRFWIDANFDLVIPKPPATAAFLFASLASSFGLLARELYLPSNLGQGALKANPTYLARLPVLDPRRVTQPASRSRDRSTIDRAFLASVGIRDIERQRTRLIHALTEAIATRRHRSK